MNALLNNKRSWWSGVRESPCLNMKLIQLITVPLALAVCCANTTPAAAANEDGVAVAIVYDTSGSMNESVKDDAGKFAPKYVIANRALAAIADRIQSFITNSATGSPRKIHAGLFVFRNDGPHAALAFGAFDAEAFKTWARNFSKPTGGTPLGKAVDAASRTVLKSGLSRKHVLVITDGMNTVGPGPAATLARIQEEAGQKQTSVSVHFVAFDVDAKVFEGVKKLGATVVGAANESQLNTQLEFILEKKILLEDEEPPTKK